MLRSWQEFCQSAQSAELAGEVIAGRAAVGIRCIASRDDTRLWVDAETGLVLTLVGSRGEGTWPSDFEIAAVEYNPAFASDTFRVEAPPGVNEAMPELPASEASSPSEPADSTTAEFFDSLSNVSGFELAAGEIASPFSGPLLDGNAFDLIELRGQPVLIMLWADWCPPCVDNLAPFQAVADQWAGRVQFVSVLTLESTPEFAPQIAEEHGFTVPVVIDLTDRLWGGLGIPAFVLLDQEGRVLAGFLGAPGNDPESAAQTLDSLLEHFLG